ncbi:MAG: hypothetical protein PHY16_14990 [Methylobacter sp.]|nr:hypothetical protein [Methylobacter sp.]
MKITPVYRKIVYGSILAAIALFVAIPDVIVELLLEFVHLLFESIESVLDTFIEHLFHTDLHQTQVIVFYILLILVMGGLYGLWLVVPPFCRQCKEDLLDFCSDQKTRFSLYWNQLSSTQKIKLATITAGASYLFLVIFIF